MRTALTVTLLALLCAAARPADNWTRFRGPNGSGHSDATGLPTSWDEKSNVVWKTRIHDKGWSSPVVWGKQVWLTTATDDGKELFALCIDHDSGKVLHDRKLFENEKLPYTFNNNFNSHASPTPAIEEGRVYIHFGSSGTACLDTKTFKTLWSRRDLKCDHWRGPASSPVLWEDLLILTFDGYDKQYVTALNKFDGKTVWKTDRNVKYDIENGDLKKGYSTPAIFDIGGKQQLVSPSAGGTVAYEPRSGKEIWKVNHGGMNVAAPPQYGHGLIFLITGYGGFQLHAVRTGGRGDVTDTHVVWKYSRAVPTRPSPILVGDLLYMVSDSGVISCMEAKTGAKVWAKQYSAPHSASPLYADGHLYFFDEVGKTRVLATGRKRNLLAVNQLATGCMATPAIAGKALFLRTKTHLYRVEKK
jgi:outer membrane protein assembly factor BamB